MPFPLLHVISWKPWQAPGRSLSVSLHISRSLSWKEKSCQRFNRGNLIRGFGYTWQRKKQGNTEENPEKITIESSPHLQGAGKRLRYQNLEAQRDPRSSDMEKGWRPALQVLLRRWVAAGALSPKSRAWAPSRYIAWVE